LNDQYGNIKSHVLLMDPFPSILEKKLYIMQQERQLIGSNVVLTNIDTKIVVIVNTTTSTYNSCGKNGHVESTCYKKNEFPNNKGSKRMCTQ